MTKADLKIYQHFIDGAYVDPVGGEWFDTLDPFRGEAWARIPRGTAADADLAVRSAARSMYQGPWASMTPSARGKLMRKLGDLVALNAERLALIEVRDNGKLLAEMASQLRWAGVGGGQFVEPTIFVDVKNDVRIAQEEVFGPVLSVIGFETEDEAVEIGNGVIYGLASGVWTKDIARAIRMSNALKAGMVWVNTYRAISFMMPFGGMNHSGIGRENGIEAIRDFLEIKSVWISTAQSSPANPFIMR